MLKTFEKEMMLLEKKEKKLLQVKPSSNQLKAAIYEKVPDGLIRTLEAAFEKAFKLIFLKGTKVIEKTFDKENINLGYEAGNFVVDKTKSRKSLKRLDKEAVKGSLLNQAATTVSGFGLGLAGLGIPDIPLLVSTLLKGIYELALGYGFDYESEQEKIYVLRLIRTALAQDEKKLLYNQQLDSRSYKKGTLPDEIKETAHIMANALLVEKFVQGIPVVGVIGGVVNFGVYKKVTALAKVKYKKRYLQMKIK